MNRLTRALPVLIIAGLVWVNLIAQGIASPKQLEVSGADASREMIKKLSTLANTSKSLSYIVAARDEPDTNCRDLGACKSR
jgi:hypothetical protein